jgi:hypothetical protein
VPSTGRRILTIPSSLFEKFQGGISGSGSPEAVDRSNGTPMRNGVSSSIRNPHPFLLQQFLNTLYYRKSSKKV